MWWFVRHDPRSFADILTFKLLPAELRLREIILFRDMWFCRASVNWFQVCLISETSRNMGHKVVCRWQSIMLCLMCPQSAFAWDLRETCKIPTSALSTTSKVHSFGLKSFLPRSSFKMQIVLWKRFFYEEFYQIFPTSFQQYQKMGVGRSRGDTEGAVRERRSRSPKAIPEVRILPVAI